MALAAARAMPSAASVDPEVVRALAEVADYVSRLRQAIGALRVNEAATDRIPMAHEELGSVVTATASATNTIMAAAEGILALPSGPKYRDGVEDQVNTIFEACAFQDLTGQRIAKVVDALGLLEGRLSRFAQAVNARDTRDELDPEEARRKARAETLLLNGPAKDGAATSQDEIDALFG